MNFEFFVPSLHNWRSHTADADGQQVDLHSTNSWLLKLNEVSTVEMLEVQLVNIITNYELLMRSHFSEWCRYKLDY